MIVADEDDTAPEDTFEGGCGTMLIVRFPLVTFSADCCCP